MGRILSLLFIYMKLRTRHIDVPPIQHPIISSCLRMSHVFFSFNYYLYSNVFNKCNLPMSSYLQKNRKTKYGLFLMTELSLRFMKFG